MTVDSDALRADLRDQVAALRLALREEAPATDRLPVLAEMVGVLVDLCRRWPEEAADMQGDIATVYAHAKRMAAGPPGSISLNSAPRSASGQPGRSGGLPMSPVPSTHSRQCSGGCRQRTSGAGRLPRG